MIYRCLVIVCFFSLSQGFSLEFGNPYLPQIPQQGFWTSEDAWAGATVGYVGEWIHDLNLEVKRPKKGFRKDVNQFETWSHLGELAVNLGQRFQFYGQTGVMKAELCQRPISNTIFEIETKSQFAGGLGARVVLIEWSYVAIGVNANGLVSWMDVDQIEQNKQPALVGNSFIQYKNWQIGGNIGAHLGPALPYVGLSYQSATVKLKDLPKLAGFGFNSNPRKLKSRTHVVVFLGSGLTLQRGFDLNFEVRMIGEIGGSLSADLRF